MIARHLGFAAFSCLVTIVTLGCNTATDSNAKMVQIGSTKADLFGLPAEYRALHPRLEEALASRVFFRAQPGGQAIFQQLNQGDIHFAILSASEFASIDDPAPLVLVATAINELGKTSRKGLVVVKSGSHVKTISDIKGKRFAFGTHGDLLTDFAARAALEKNGVPVKDILLELVPPPFSFEGHLYMKDDVAKTMITDLTVNSGLIDEIAYSKLPETGGNVITGPSKDQFTIVGETDPVPEMVVVASQAADNETTRRLKDYLLNRAKDDPDVCRQLGIKGFAPADRAAYEHVRTLLPKKK